MRASTGAFSAADGGSRVAWAVEITELGGLLKAVPQGLTKAAAQKVIADAWTAVEARLTAQASVPGG